MFIKRIKCAKNDKAAQIQSQQASDAQLEQRLYVQFVLDLRRICLATCNGNGEATLNKIYEKYVEDLESNERIFKTVCESV